MSKPWRIAAGVGLSCGILGVLLLGGYAYRSNPRPERTLVASPVVETPPPPPTVLLATTVEEPAFVPVSGESLPLVNPPQPPPASPDEPSPLTQAPAPPDSIGAAPAPPSGSTPRADEDPERSAREFVEKTRKEAEAAKLALEGEAKNLRTRLRSVESALQRWESLIAALERDGRVAGYREPSPVELGRREIVEAPRIDAAARTSYSVSGSGDLPLPEAPALEPVEPKDGVAPTPLEKKD